MNSMTFVEYLELEQFSVQADEKKSALTLFLGDLHAFHLANSADYYRINQTVFKGIREISSLAQLPFVPVTLFKSFGLKSIAEADVYKILTSSGTTGSVPSRIYLNRETAMLQSSALAKIITRVVGKERLPMLMVDSKQVFKDKNSFSARGAGVLGMSVFGKDHHYMLDEKFEPDYNVLSEFIAKYNGQRILIFGFTFMVWQFLMQRLNISVDFSQAILIHSGGWKKLIDQSVDNETFRAELERKTGLRQIYNFYGMVEQVGSVYIENEKGFLHCPNFSDILIRNPIDLSIQPHGKEGLVQVISPLTLSYPGHSILTEDIGVCMGEDDISWNGKYFKILGRSKKADLRGCSDTFKM
jgi:hypothetical protein